MDFELGPVPFGLDRAGIARLCKQWGWIAKPINPTKSVSALGAVWHMQSCVDPPTTVVSVKGGVDVVITKVTPKVVQPQSAQPAVASAETIGLCAMNSGEVKPVDPWVLKDPWGYVAPTVGVSQPVPFDLEASLHRELSERYLQRFLPKPVSQKPIRTWKLGMEKLAIVFRCWKSRSHDWLLDNNSWNTELKSQRQARNPMLRFANFNIRCRHNLRFKELGSKRCFGDR